jgi:phage shock protein A
MEQSCAANATTDGPSNMDLWNMVVNLQQQLKQLQTDKDAQLNELNELLNKKNDKIIELNSRVHQLEQDLSTTMDQLMMATGKRNLLGALECIANTIP